MGLSDKFNKFTEGIGDNFSQTKDYIESGNLTKSAMVLITGVIMTGCNAMDSEYTKAAKQFEQNHPEQIQEINYETLRKIADGESGVYKHEGNRLLFLSNYDDSQPMTHEEENAMHEAIPEDLLVQTNRSFQKRSSPLDPLHQKFYHHEATYINVKKDQTLSAIKDLNSEDDDLKIIDDKGNNRIVALHEVAHYLTKPDMKAKIGEYNNTQVNEFVADTLSTALYAKIYDKDLSTYMEMLDENEVYREGYSRTKADYGHYTVSASNTMQLIFNKDPSMFEKMKDMTLEQLTDVHIYASNNIPYIDIDEDAVMDEELVNKEIKSDIESYSSTGEIPTDSQMFNYFDSYKHKYKNLIHNTSSQTEDVQQHIIDVSYERAHKTEIMKARAEAITIDHPSIDDIYNFMEKTYQEGRGSGKVSEATINR